jgi:hypothetical protein
MHDSDFHIIAHKLVTASVITHFVTCAELSRYAGPLGGLAMKYIMSWAPFAVTIEVSMKAGSQLFRWVLKWHDTAYNTICLGLKGSP